MPCGKATATQPGSIWSSSSSTSTRQQAQSTGPRQEQKQRKKQGFVILVTGEKSISQAKRSRAKGLWLLLRWARCLCPAALGPNANSSLSVHVVGKAAGLHGLSTVPDAAPLGRDTCWTGSWWLEVLGVEAGKTTSLMEPLSSSKEMWCSPAGYPIRSNSP